MDFGSSLGESPPVRERLIVSPGWGRVRRGVLETGDRVEQGMVIGHVVEAHEQCPLVAHVAGSFAGWLVWEGERVPPGRAIALLIGG